MRIVVNNLTAIRQKTGIGHYVSELVHTLRTEHPEHRIVTYPGPMMEAATRALSWMRKGLRSARSNSPGGAAKKSGGGGLRKLLTTRARGWADWHFRTFWSGRSFDLYHEPNYIPFPCAKPTVATIHDLSPLLHPEWHPAERVAHYERHFATGLRRCAHLLADSEFTRGELIEHFHVKPATVTCVPLGVHADTAADGAGGNPSGARTARPGGAVSLARRDDGAAKKSVDPLARLRRSALVPP